MTPKTDLPSNHNIICPLIARIYHELPMKRVPSPSLKESRPLLTDAVFHVMQVLLFSLCLCTCYPTVHLNDAISGKVPRCAGACNLLKIGVNLTLSNGYFIVTTLETRINLQVREELFTRQLILYRHFPRAGPTRDPCRQNHGHDMQRRNILPCRLPSIVVNVAFLAGPFLWKQLPELPAKKEMLFGHWITFCHAF